MCPRSWAGWPSEPVAAVAAAAAAREISIVPLNREGKGPGSAALAIKTRSKRNTPNYSSRSDDDDGYPGSLWVCGVEDQPISVSRSFWAKPDGTVTQELFLFFNKTRENWFLSCDHLFSSIPLNKLTRSKANNRRPLAYRLKNQFSLQEMNHVLEEFIKNGKFDQL